MKEAYQVCIKVCPVWTDIYSVLEKGRTNMKDRNGLRYVQNINKQCRLILPSTCNAEGKNFLEITIAEAYAATAHGRIEKTIKALTDKFDCQFFSLLVREYVGTCNICKRTKYSQREPIGYVIPLHMPVRLWSNLTMDFLKLLPIFTKCSLVYPNIPAGEDHMVCIARLWRIVNRQSGFKFLIPAPDSLTAVECTATFNSHVVPTMGYLYCIVFDQETLFMLSHFQSWAASNGIKQEPTTAYQPQTDSQLEIVNKEIIQVARACKAEGNTWLSKIPEIQLRLNSSYNTSRRNNPFITVLGFDAKLGLDIFPYHIKQYQTATERNNAASQALTNAKASQAKHANLHHTTEP